MNTIYDWVTMALFAALIVLFLHRSDAATPPRDRLWQYLLASIGCGLVNWLGNTGRVVPTLAVGVALIVFILVVLKPFDGIGRRR